MSSRSKATTKADTATMSRYYSLSGIAHMLRCSRLVSTPQCRASAKAHLPASSLRKCADDRAAISCRLQTRSICFGSCELSSTILGLGSCTIGRCKHIPKQHWRLSFSLGRWPCWTSDHRQSLVQLSLQATGYRATSESTCQSNSSVPYQC